jgi:flagellar hook-length control protein FliK
LSPAPGAESRLTRELKSLATYEAAGVADAPPAPRPAPRAVPLTLLEESRHHAVSAVKIAHPPASEAAAGAPLAPQASPEQPSREWALPAQATPETGGTNEGQFALLSAPPAPLGRVIAEAPEMSREPLSLQPNTSPGRPGETASAKFTAPVPAGTSERRGPELLPSPGVSFAAEDLRAPSPGRRQLDQPAIEHRAASDSEPGAIATGGFADYDIGSHPVADAQSSEESTQLKTNPGERRASEYREGEALFGAPPAVSGEVNTAALRSALKPVLREAARVTAELRGVVEPVTPGVATTTAANDLSSVAPPTGRDFTPAPAADEMPTAEASDAAPRRNAPSVQKPSAAASAKGTEIAPLPAASDSDEKAAAAVTVGTNDGARAAAEAPTAQVSRVRPPESFERRSFTDAAARSDAPLQPQPGREVQAVGPLALPRGGATDEAATGQSQESANPAAPQSHPQRQAAEIKLPLGGEDSFAPSAVVGRGEQWPQVEAGQLPRPSLDLPGGFHAPQSVVAQAVNRIAGAAESVARRETQTLRFELRPEHLGRVEVELTRGDEGGLRARLTAERGEAGHALQEGISQLRESLERAGVAVERLEVSTRPSLSDAAGSRQHREAPEHSPPASRPHVRGGSEQPEADDAPRAVGEERIISLRA